MRDLNSLVPAESPLYLLNALAVNDADEMVGFGVTDGGEVHGFLATPTSLATQAFVPKSSAKPPAPLRDEAHRGHRFLFWGYSLLPCHDSAQVNDLANVRRRKGRNFVENWNRSFAAYRGCGFIVLRQQWMGFSDCMFWLGAVAECFWKPEHRRRLL